MFIGSSNEIGDFESGVMASLDGTVPAVLIGGSITLLIVTITYFKTTSLLPLRVSDIHTVEVTEEKPATA